MRVVPLVLAGIVLAVLATNVRRLPRPALAIGTLILAVLVVYGLGLVDPPNVEEVLLDVGEAFGRWAYLLVAGLAFIETGAFVGLVAPGEVAVIAGGVFAGQGNLKVVLLIALVWAACAAGDSLSFWLGRRLGRGWLVKHGPKFRITEPRLAKVEGFFERRGGITILIGRFIGFVRPLAPFVAGASRMPYPRFLAYDIVGTGVWTATFVLLGYFSWRNIDRATEIASRGTLVAGTTLGVVVTAVVAHRFLRTPEQRAAVRRWVRERRGGGTVEPSRHNEGQ